MIEQLIAFLSDPKEEVRAMAVQHLVGFTPKESEFHEQLLDPRLQLFAKLKVLCLENLTIAHDALRALINLSGDITKCQELIDEEFIVVLVKFIMHPKFILADLCCMLLCNLSKAPKCNAILLQSEDPSSFGQILDRIVDIFNASKSHNEKANFDFLAPVFANIALLSEGRRYFLDQQREIPLLKLAVYTQHDSVIRRGGVISTIKNCCLDVSRHLVMLDRDFIVNLLMPLIGPEELEEDDMDGMPEELQYMEEDKKRESDPGLRKSLLDIILLLCSSRSGRETLRGYQTYPIIRELNLAETDQQCDKVEKGIVNMLKRDDRTTESASKIVQVEDDGGLEDEETKVLYEAVAAKQGELNDFLGIAGR